MERARPPRSGIPTFVGSNGGRVHSQGQERGESGSHHSTDKISSNVTSSTGRSNNVTSSNRKEKLITGGRHASTRQQLNESNNNHVGGPDNWECRPPQNLPHPGYCHTPKHRPPTGRQYMTYAQVKRNDTCNNSERASQWKAESSHLSNPQQQTPTDVTLESGFDLGFSGQHETSHTEFDPLETDPLQDPRCFLSEHAILTSDVNSDIVVPGSACDENSALASNSSPPVFDDNPSVNTSASNGALTRNVNEISSTPREVTVRNVNEAINSDSETHTNSREAVLSDMDYPIRGTISPLTNKIAVKRSAGTVDEVSFVFGRPVSPTNEQVVRCSSPQSFVNPDIARCLSSSQNRYTSRSLSPSSDVLPMRRGIALGAYRGMRVLSPPSVLGVGVTTESRMHHQGGICCEHCNGCLVELKRQALTLMFPDSGSGCHLAQSIRVDNIGERLSVPEDYERWFSRTGNCSVCETALSSLKQEAVAMIQSIQLAQTTATSASIPALVGSCGHLSQHRNRYTSRQGKPPSPYASSSSLSSCTSSPPFCMPLAAQAQAYLEQNVRAYISPKKYSQILASRLPGVVVQNAQQDLHYDTPNTQDSLSDTSGTSALLYRSPAGHYHQLPLDHHQWPGYLYLGSNTTTSTSQHVPLRSVNSSSPTSSPTSPPPGQSAAVSFFARAAQKLGKKKKRHHSLDQQQLPSFPTNFADVIRLTPPPAPPCLIRTVGRLQNPGMGKVKVMLKICSPTGPQGEQGASFLSTDPRKKQVTVFDPSASGYVTSSNRRTGTAVPKMFAFDSVFTPDDSLTELCASSLAEIVQAVVAGADGCLFTYGYSKLGKTYTMIGSDQSPTTLGVMPCAIAWLFKLINEQKDKTGARFSVRVSAVQVTGKDEVLRDLLTDIAQGAEATGVGTAPSVYLREDPICGTQLENQSELRAPTADKAAFYLDAALASRSAADEDEVRSSHMLFTLNVYQYRIEKANTKAGLPGVAGGRSRLHLIDFGTASKSKDPNNVSLSLSALGNVIMALLNGQRHVPHRDSKMTQLLRDSLGNLSCRTCMIAHVSSSVPHYNQTLQVIQLAARIHRMKRRRTKFSSTSSEDSSTDGDVKFRRPYRGLRMGTLREDVLYSSSHSDPDYTSSSEQSCDTVIYIGACGQSLSDRELTDNEGPPRHVPRTNPRLPRRPSGSRSSGDDSDSGRSMHSVRSLESRLPIRAFMSPLPVSAVTAAKSQPQSMPGSPNPGLVRIGHRVDLSSKRDLSGTEGRISASDVSSPSGHWQDRSVKIHCHSSQTKLAKAIHDKQLPPEGEQWIDGPGAVIYPESISNEMWVDGPPTFVVQQQTNSLLSASPSLRDENHHHRSDSSSRRVATKKVDAEEQWVDGPMEMLTGNSPSQPMHTCSKTEYTPKPTYQKTCMSTAVNDKALKQALVKHIMETKDSPESSLSVDTNSSLAVEAADSCSISINSSDDQMKISGHKKDKSQCSSSQTSDCKHVDASSSPMLSTKASKLSESPKKIHSSTQSPVPSPSPSPSVTRKCSKLDSAHRSRLQKSQLPGSGSPTRRVVQWIKSVSSKQHESTEISSSDARKIIPNEHYQTQAYGTSESVTMADAETNTDHDSDFERLAEENGVRSDNEEDEKVCKMNINVKCEPYDSDDIKCNIAIDTSLDSSFDTSIAIHESIYEHEVEECLELMKTKDGSRLASEVDNETFSNMSCSNKDPDERDQFNQETESLLIQNTKALTESKQAAQLARHIACDRHMRSTSTANSDCNNDILEISRPLLSRKPDGASNPNLLKVFLEEGLLEKTQCHGLNNSSVEAMFVSATHNDSGIDFPSTSSKSCVTGTVEEDSFCDNGVSVQSLCGKGDGSSSGYTSSPKLGAKNKPPLPTKLSPMLKHSGLPKSCTNSQAPVGYNSPHSIYCTAKPTYSGKDSPGVQQKMSPGGKTSGIPLSNFIAKGKIARGDKTCSSSATSHSPQSSANSSPFVSSTSKSSSSSSPAQKASAKSNNGSTSKSYSSKILSTSAKENGKPRKKEKDIKGGSITRTTKLSNLVNKGKGNDSDSGNDSGIVALERRLLSPYATITKPRTPSHSSSGHGSDNSTISTDVQSGNPRQCTKAENLHGGTSSGYESMLRDSEATGSSSGHEDSGSEVSLEGQTESKRKGTRRSRSAPSRSTESSPVSSQPSQSGTRSTVSAHRAWVDTRHLHKVKDEPLELKRYDPDEVERLGRRRTDEEVKTSMGTKQRNCYFKAKEDGDELSDSKDRIMMERNGWSFDCKFLMCFSCKSGQRGTDV